MGITCSREQCDELLKKLFIDHSMTRQKLVHGLILIIGNYYNLIISGGAVLAMYSGIETDDLSIAFMNKSDWKIFEAKCKKIFTKKFECMFNFLENVENTRIYVIQTLNGTKLKININCWYTLQKILPDCLEESLFIHGPGNVVKCQTYLNQYQYMRYTDAKSGMNYITDNLERKILTPNPVTLSHSDAMLFKINRLLRLNKKIKQGYVIHNVPKYNVCSKQRLINLFSVMNNFSKSLINIITGYVENEYYGNGSICGLCKEKFVNHDCFMPYCDCENEWVQGEDWNQCFIHYLTQDGVTRSGNMIPESNLLLHYECYKDVILDFWPRSQIHSMSRYVRSEHDVCS